MIVLQLLVALVVIVATTRLIGYIFQRIDQPAVIGELVGGILLGPSLLGWVAPEIYAALLPPAVMPLLRLHAQAGVIFFMFLAGLELDVPMIRRSTRATLVISTASIVLPFVLGYALAYVLYPQLAPSGVEFTPYALFIGVSMSITAFPVLVRILRDRGLSRTRMGNVALACAAVNDVTAWCLLALVISISEFGDWGSALSHVPGVIAGHLQHYAIFAAFFAGAIMPGKARQGGALHDRLVGFLSILFLPVFFALQRRPHPDRLADSAGAGAVRGHHRRGLRGQVRRQRRRRASDRHRWRDSARSACSMNTRGLVELVVLNIGLDLGVISPTLFTMMVVMALVTTFMTSPLLQMLLRNSPWTSEVRVNVDPAVRSAWKADTTVGRVRTVRVAVDSRPMKRFVRGDSPGADRRRRPLGESPAVTVFENARVIVGAGRPPIERGVLVVQNGRVTAAGDRGSVNAPANAARVDLTGKTVMPAIVNGHIHLGFQRGPLFAAESYTRENIVDQLNRYAVAGVAAVLSLGTDAGPIPDAIRADQRSGKLGGALFRMAGRGIAPPDAGPANAAMKPSAYGVRTEEEARAAVREQAARGVDVIKIWVDDRNGTVPKLSPELARAVIDEAHKHKLKAIAHIFYLDDAKWLARAGVNGFAHLMRDREADDELVTLMRDNGVVIIPNMAINQNAIYTAPPDWLDDPLFRAVTTAEDADRIRAVVQWATAQSVERQRPRFAAWSVSVAG